MAKTLVVRDDFEPLFFDEVGRLVVAAGRIEYELKLCIKDLRGAGFTAGMLEAEQVRHLSDLCDEVSKSAKAKLEPEPLRKFLLLICEIRVLAEHRNDTVHALWTATDTREPLRVRPEIKGKKATKSVNWSKTKLMPLNELRKVRRQLEDAYVSLQCQRNTWVL